MKAFLGVVSRLAAAAALAGALRGGAVAFPTVNNGDGTFSYAVNVVRQYDETVTAQKSGLASLLSETLGSNTNYYLGMNGTRLYEGSDASLAVVTRTERPTPAPTPASARWCSSASPRI